MTCIVGLIDKGVVYMGGDSCKQLGDFFSLGDPKVLSYSLGNEPCLFGFAGNVRDMSVIEDILEGYLTKCSSIPNPKQLFAIHLVDKIKQVLHESGTITKDEEGVESMNTQLLIGYRGFLYRMLSNFGVSTFSDYVAIGTGAEVALGALFTSSSIPNPEERILLALKAAEKHIINVRSPFTILHT